MLLTASLFPSPVIAELEVGFFEEGDEGDGVRDGLSFPGVSGPLPEELGEGVGVDLEVPLEGFDAADVEGSLEGLPEEGVAPGPKTLPVQQ